MTAQGITQVVDGVICAGSGRGSEKRLDFARQG
jgi:hypothetical protein